MTKYLIKWNAGFGEYIDICQAKSLAEAELMAADAWRDEAESAAEYSAHKITPEIAEDYGLEYEAED